MLADMSIDQWVQQRAIFRRQNSSLAQQFAQCLVFVQKPRLHSLKQIGLGDKIHLQRENPE